MTSPKAIDYDDIQVGDTIEKVTVTTADNSYRSSVIVKITRKNDTCFLSEAGVLYKDRPGALLGVPKVTWFLIDRPWSEPPVGSILADSLASVYRHTSAGWRNNNGTVVESDIIQRALEGGGYTILREGYGQ
jgi:hypothetical protein